MLTDVKDLFGDRDHPRKCEDAAPGLVVAPMPGRVVSMLVDRDSRVQKRQALMVIDPAAEN